MRYIPEHVLQRGGVVPINTPLMEKDNLTPLIQVASMPVDVGISTSLQLRGQELHRRALRNQEEQFKWQQEKWEEEFDFKKHVFKTESMLAQIKLFNEMTSSQMGTGVSRAGASATGLPSNFDTAHQQLVMAEVERKRGSMIAEYVNDTQGRVLEDPGKLFQFKTDLENVGRDEYANAMAQVVHHRKQLETFQLGEGRYDTDLFSYGMQKYGESQDLTSKQKLIYDSPQYAAQQVVLANKDRWGMPEMTDIGGDFALALQHSPDIRGDFAMMLLQSYGPTIAAKHAMLKDLSTKGQAPDPGDLDQWAINYVERLTNSYMKPSVNTIGTPQDLLAREGKGKSGPTSSIWSNEGIGTYHEVAGIDAKISPAQIIKYAPNPSKGSQIALDWTAGSGKVQPDKVTAEGRVAAETAVKVVMGEDVDMNKYINAENQVSPEGEKAIKEYMDMFNKRINQKIQYVAWGDIKDDGVLSNAQGSEAAVDNFVTNLTSAQVYDLRTGEAMTGNDFWNKYGEEFEGDKAKLGKAMSIPGIIDVKNIIPLSAKGGNQIIDTKLLGTVPYYASLATKDGLKDFAIVRESTFLNSNQGKAYKAGNMYWNDVAVGIGTQVPYNKEAGEIALSTIPGLTGEDKKRIQDNMVGMRLGEGDSMVFEYGTKSDTVANATLQVTNPYMAPSGIAITDYLTKGLGADNEVSVTQDTDPNTKQPVWVVRIDDKEPIVVSQSSETAIQHAAQALQQYRQASQGQSGMLGGAPRTSSVQTDGTSGLPGDMYGNAPTQTSRSTPSGSLSQQQVPSLPEDMYGNNPTSTTRNANQPVPPLPDDFYGGSPVALKDEPNPEVVVNPPLDTSKVPYGQMPVRYSPEEAAKFDPGPDSTMTAFAEQEERKYQERLAKQTQKQQAEELAAAQKEVTREGLLRDASQYFTKATIAPKVEMKLTKMFATDWGSYMDPILPDGYKVTSVWRDDTGMHGKGLSVDLTGKDDTLITWFQKNVPGIRKMSGKAVEYRKIPNTPFAVTWHQNQTAIKDANGRTISWKPEDGYHFDIKYAANVNLK